MISPIACDALNGMSGVRVQTCYSSRPPRSTIRIPLPGFTASVYSQVGGHRLRALTRTARPCRLYGGEEGQGGG